MKAAVVIAVALLASQSVSARTLRQADQQGPIPTEPSGCPRFPDFCSPECTFEDQDHCMMCGCQNSENDGQPTSATQNGNNNPLPSVFSLPAVNIQASLTRAPSTQPPITPASIHQVVTSPPHKASVSHSGSGNLNGCPPFPKACRATCLEIDNQGCVTCSCAQLFDQAAGDVLTGNKGGSNPLLGSPALALDTHNNNGCPPFYQECPADATSLDSNGCPVCKQVPAAGTSHTGNAGEGSLSHVMSVAATHNLNGCPAYSNLCPSQCSGLDGEGCPVCLCSPNGSGAVGGGAGASAGSSPGVVTIHLPDGAAHNLNGCPTYPESCPTECARLDGDGCPVCGCPNNVAAGGSLTWGLMGSNSNHGQTSTTHGNSLYGGIVTHITNNNGCPAFPPSCSPACAMLNDVGCPVCSAACQASINQTPGHGGANTGNVDVTHNNNGCAPFNPDCPSECVQLSTSGCVVCGCAVQTPAPTHAPLAGSTNSCPRFDPHCSPECVTVSKEGCVVCTCSSGGSSGPGTDTSTPCPAFNPTLCSGCSIGVDSRGCLACSCPAHTLAPVQTTQASVVTTVPAENECPYFDDTCSNNCVVIDANSCVVCTCAGANVVTQVPVATQPPAITQAPVVTTKAPAYICPPFDPQCLKDCLAIDPHGCIICTCPGENTATQNPAASQAPVVTTSAPAYICPPYDPQCPSQCNVIDANRCVVCSCPDGGNRSGLTTVSPGIPNENSTLNFHPGSLGNEGQTGFQPGTLNGQGSTGLDIKGNNSTGEFHPGSLGGPGPATQSPVTNNRTGGGFNPGTLGGSDHTSPGDFNPGSLGNGAGSAGDGTGNFSPGTSQGTTNLGQTGVATGNGTTAGGAGFTPGTLGGNGGANGTGGFNPGTAPGNLNQGQTGGSNDANANGGFSPGSLGGSGATNGSGAFIPGALPGNTNVVQTGGSTESAAAGSFMPGMLGDGSVNNGKGAFSPGSLPGGSTAFQTGGSAGTNPNKSGGSFTPGTLGGGATSNGNTLASNASNGFQAGSLGTSSGAFSPGNNPSQPAGGSNSSGVASFQPGSLGTAGGAGGFTPGNLNGGATVGNNSFTPGSMGDNSAVTAAPASVQMITQSLDVFSPPASQAGLQIVTQATAFTVTQTPP